MKHIRLLFAGMTIGLALVSVGLLIPALHASTTTRIPTSTNSSAQTAPKTSPQNPPSAAADSTTATPPAPTPAASTVMQSKTDRNLKGIDISHWDGEVDWAQVKRSGVSFVYIKASGGLKTDPKFSTNVKGAKMQGLAVGAYHYAKPTAPFQPSEAQAQARYFVNAMETGGLESYGSIMPVLDLEEPSKPGQLSPDELADWTRIFVDTVKDLTHRQVMLYTGIWFIQKNAGFNGKLSDLPLWVADYVRLGDKQPPVSGGWTKWTVWQYSDQGTQPGIQGQVDLDAGPNSLSELEGE